MNYPIIAQCVANSLHRCTVKVYSNDKGIYTVVDAGSVFEMTNDFKGKYIGELKDFPSDITHWGKLIDVKETPSQMQIGISHLNKI